MLASLRRAARELGRTLFDLVLPGDCPGCGGPGAPLCPLCRVHLQRRTGPACRRCGEPLLTPGQPCPLGHRWLAGLAWARAPFAYAGTGGALVRRFKLDQDFAAGQLLARAMAQAVAPALAGPWRRPVAVAVPLHWRRKRSRGFDQAAWLAGELAARHRLPGVLPALVRQRATLPQGDPRVLGRERNVEGAFAPARGVRLAGQRVLLVDDVVTSGATARACAFILLAAGAREVALVTACRS